MPSVGNIKAVFQQIAHTLLVSIIVAIVTMFGTVRVVEAKMESLEKTVTRLVDHLERVSLRQASAIAQANEIHRSLQERLTTLEQGNANRRRLP